jgi:hypothetical protein
MERNTLELARDSLFIEQIKNSFKATELSIVQDADAISEESELLTPHLWQNLSELFEIHKNFYRKIAGTQNGLNSPFVLRVDTKHHRRIDYLYPFGVSGWIPP